MNSPNYISPHFQKVHYPSSRNRDFRAAEGLGGGQVGDPVELVNVTKTEYQYKYNGFEYQDELGLNWYDYLARKYDPALGRWMNIDPLAEMSRKTSPYVYALNNPVFYIDADGMLAESFDLNIDLESDWIPNGDGTYTAEAGDSAATLSKDAGISYERANEIVQSQLGENYIDTDGVEKSNVEVGDVVTIPEEAKAISERLANEATNKKIDNQVKTIDNKINKLSTDIKDSHKKYSVLEAAETFDRRWIDSMGEESAGRSAGTAKLQQMYERDSVNKSKERTSLQKDKQTLLKSKKTN